MADYWDIATGEPLEDGDLDVRYKDMLDEVYGDFMDSYPASRVLEAVDPIAYRVGFSEWLDSELGETITEEEPIDDGEDDRDTDWKFGDEA
jgi:hypothetical protein